MPAVTFAGAREELATAFEAQGVNATYVVGGKPVPYVLIAQGGISDPSHVVRGELLADFRMIFLAGPPDSERAVTDLDDMKTQCISQLRLLEGWRLGSMGADGIRTYAGGQFLSADLTASRFIALLEGD